MVEDDADSSSSETLLVLQVRTVILLQGNHVLVSASTCTL